MPIYEFRCLKCDEVFELLKVGDEDEIEMRCPYCQSPDFERVMSTTTYTVGPGRGEARRPTVESRQCASGTCTSVEIPGYSKS